MNIHSAHPKYTDFLDQEIRTLNILANSAFVSKKFNSLSNRAQLAFYSYKDLTPRQKPKTNFSFTADFDLMIEKKLRKVVIETQIVSEYNIASYVLSICKKNRAPYAVARKFHFDYALPIENDPFPKPVYHLQYGGEQSPHLASLLISVDHLLPWLSLPRINFIPMNLALLLDMVFSQFRYQDTIDIVEERKWRDHIKSNEEFLLKPYYATVYGFLTTRHKYDFLIRDYNYGR